nr:NUDIX domain-containing protein [Macrococcus goetzii]
MLLQKRSDKKMWGLPGGAMELGESYEAVAIIETKEETGLNIEHLKFIYLFSGEDIHYIYLNGDEVYNTIALYESRTFSEEIRNSDESIDLNWFNINNLPNSIAPPKARHEFY